MSQFVQVCTYLKKTFLMNFIGTLKIRCFLTTKMQHLTKSLPSNGLKIKHINFPLLLNQPGENAIRKTFWKAPSQNALFWRQAKSLALKFFRLMVIEICYNKNSFEYFTESWERSMTTQLAMSVFTMSDDYVENKTCN